MEAVLSFQAPRPSPTGLTLTGGSRWHCWDAGLSVQLTNHGPGAETSNDHQDWCTNECMEFGVSDNKSGFSASQDTDVGSD